MTEYTESIMRTNECDQLVSAVVSALRHFREAPPQVAWKRGTSLRLIECLIKYSATLATDASYKLFVSLFFVFLPGVTSASESNLASSSPVKSSLSCALSSRKSAQSTSSLDRLREETTPKRLPPKSSSIGKQSFIPRKTSTPARSDTCRHTLHLTSLPEISLPALSQPNRWSLIDTSHEFSGAGVSSRSLNSPSDSEGSELQFSMDSLLESGTESERWVRGHGKAPSFPNLFPVLLP